MKKLVICSIVVLATAAGLTPALTGDDLFVIAVQKGSCPLIGTWSGPVPGGPMAGQTNLWKFQANGITLSTIGSVTINGTWSVTGNTAKLKDTSSNPGYIACPPTDEGTYTLSFSADCNTVTFTKSVEPCPGREVAVDGFSGTRQ
jgi:hypothetical protein